MSGALFSILADAVAKGALFLAVSDATHGFRDLEGLGAPAACEVARRGSRSTIVLAGFSVVGLPPLGGFFGKWYVLLGALESDRNALAGVVVLGGLISAAYVFRVIDRLCFSSPGEVDDSGDRVDDGEASGLGLRGAMVALALIVVALGLVSRPIIALIDAALQAEVGR